MMQNSKLLPFQEKAKKARFLLLLALLLSLLGSLSGKEFIGAEPAVIALQDIVPGYEYDIYQIAGYEIIIPNSLGDHSMYVIKVNPPEKVKKPLKGFLPLPDPDWFELSEDTIEVEPFDTGRVRYKIKVPEGDEYFNQAYQIEINSKRRPSQKKKTKVGAGVGIVVSLNLEYFIETRPHPEKEPTGVIGVTPSQFYIVNPEYDSDTTMYFRLFNNDTVDHEYTLRTYIPPPQDTLSLRLDIPLTPNFEWIPEDKKDEWIEIKKPTIKVEAGKSKKVELGAHFPDMGVPPDQLVGKGWEGIVAVVPESGDLSRFTRVKFVFPSKR